MLQGETLGEGQGATPGKGWGVTQVRGDSGWGVRGKGTSYTLCQAKGFQRRLQPQRRCCTYVPTEGKGRGGALWEQGQRLRGRGRWVTSLTMVMLVEVMHLLWSGAKVSKLRWMGDVPPTIPLLSDCPSNRMRACEMKMKSKTCQPVGYGHQWP